MRYSLLVAAVYRCPNCGAWWAGQSGNAPEAHLILHMVERRTTLFPWEKYRGWKRDLFDEELCPDCGQEISHPHFSLSQQAPHSKEDLQEQETAAQTWLSQQQTKE